MSFEIHIYLGTACITEKLKHKYPIGERHPFLLYLKTDSNSEYNITDAEDVVSNLGLNEIEFSKVGKLDPQKINDEEKKEHYDNAMERGSTFILYKEAV